MRLKELLDTIDIGSISIKGIELYLDKDKKNCIFKNGCKWDDDFKFWDWDETYSTDETSIYYIIPTDIVDKYDVLNWCFGRCNLEKTLQIVVCAKESSLNKFFNDVCGVVDDCYTMVVAYDKDREEVKTFPCDNDMSGIYPIYSKSHSNDGDTTEDFFYTYADIGIIIQKDMYGYRIYLAENDHDGYQEMD